MKEIHKIAAVVIQDNKFFMVRTVGKDIWTNLGGKPEGNETEEVTLLREIMEELNCDAEIIKKLADFKDKAIFHDTMVKLSVYLVNLKGDIKINYSELEECMFLPKDYKEKGIKIPRTVEEQIIPLCIKEGYLDW